MDYPQMMLIIDGEFGVVSECNRETESNVEKEGS
jgi:hypothetical protein